MRPRNFGQFFRRRRRTRGNKVFFLLKFPLSFLRSLWTTFLRNNSFPSPSLPIAAAYCTKVPGESNYKLYKCSQDRVSFRDPRGTFWNCSYFLASDNFRVSAVRTILRKVCSEVREIRLLAHNNSPLTTRYTRALIKHGGPAPTGLSLPVRTKRGSLNPWSSRKKSFEAGLTVGR